MLSICVLQENAILVFLLKNVMFNSIWYLLFLYTTIKYYLQSDQYLQYLYSEP